MQNKYNRFCCLNDEEDEEDEEESKIDKKIFILDNSKIKLDEIDKLKNEYKKNHTSSVNKIVYSTSHLCEVEKENESKESDKEFKSTNNNYSKGSETNNYDKGNESKGYNYGKGNESKGYNYGKGNESKGYNYGKGNEKGYNKGNETDNYSKGSNSKGYNKGNETNNYSKGSESKGYSKGNETNNYSKGSESKGYNKGNETNNYSKGSESKGYNKGYSKGKNLHSTNFDSSINRRAPIIIKPIEKKKNEPNHMHDPFRSRKNYKYEIPFSKSYSKEEIYIKDLGKIESFAINYKEENYKDIFHELVIKSIEYYDNKDLKQNNIYYKDFISLDENIQEQTIEKLCIHTLGFALHRFIKSNNIIFTKFILENLPYYNLININYINCKFNEKESIGIIAFNKIYNKYINSSSNEYINQVNKFWTEYIINSIFNLNNIIHDACFYASYDIIQYIAEYCDINKLNSTLLNLIETPNLENETCEILLDFLIPNKNKTNAPKCKILLDKIINFINNKTDNYDNDDDIDNVFGDDNNICFMLLNEDYEEIIQYIINLNSEKKKDIINKTLELWNLMIKDNQEKKVFLDKILKKLTELKII